MTFLGTTTGGFFMMRRINQFESQNHIQCGDHTGEGANGRERASCPDPDRKPVTAEEYIAAYNYKTDPLILHDLLRKLRKEHPEVSILRIPYYPLYSPHLTFYRLDKKKMFRGGNPHA
jgi:hypothetical protein